MLVQYMHVYIHVFVIKRISAYTSNIKRTKY